MGSATYNNLQNVKCYLVLFIIQCKSFPWNSVFPWCALWIWPQMSRVWLGSVRVRKVPTTQAHTDPLTYKPLLPVTTVSSDQLVLWPTSRNDGVIRSTGPVTYSPAGRTHNRCLMLSTQLSVARRASLLAWYMLKKPCGRPSKTFRVTGRPRECSFLANVTESSRRGSKWQAWNEMINGNEMQLHTTGRL